MSLRIKKEFYRIYIRPILLKKIGKNVCIDRFLFSFNKSRVYTNLKEESDPSSFDQKGFKLTYCRGPTHGRQPETGSEKLRNETFGLRIYPSPLSLRRRLYMLTTFWPSKSVTYKAASHMLANTRYLDTFLAFRKCNIFDAAGCSSVSLRKITSQKT